MKYALLGYDTEGALEALAADDKRALHSGHHALHDQHEAASGSVTVIAHYGFRPPRLATTVRLVGGETVTTDGGGGLLFLSSFDRRLWVGKAGDGFVRGSI